MGRLQYVSIDGSRSKNIFVHSGVPQGSHLGPLIFILFINDIVEVIQFSECLLYADDIKLYLAVNNQRDVDRLQKDVDAVHSWCMKNRLYLNVNKCKTMSFGRITKPIVANYMAFDKRLVRVFETKDLGVVFHPTMSFNRHIDVIVAKALSMLGFISRICKDFSDPLIFRRLYYAYVRSQLEYASIIWNPYYDLHIKRIEGVQKKFLINFGFKSGHIPYDRSVPFWEKLKNLPPYVDRCKAINIETLETRRQFASALFISDLLTDNISCPSLLESINLRIPRISSRTHEFLFIKSHRTNYGANEPFIRALKYFNSFVSLFDFNPKRIFKNQLKRFNYIETG